MANNKFLAHRHAESLANHPGRSLVEHHGRDEQVVDIGLQTAISVAEVFGNAVRASATITLDDQVGQHAATSYRSFREGLAANHRTCGDAEVTEDVRQFQELLNLDVGTAMIAHAQAFTVTAGRAMERPLVRDLPKRRRGLMGWLFGG